MADSRVRSTTVQRITHGFLLVCGLALVANVTLAGQTQEAMIFGQVTDESGAVLPGVTVTVASPALQLPQVVAVTDARGEYRVTPLPLGTYTVDYTLPGFQTLHREGIRLTSGFAAKIDIQLKIGAVAESITVSGESPLVDVKSTSAGTQVTREALASTPTTRNGLNSLLTLSAGSRPALDNGRVQGADPVIKAFGRANNGWVMVNGIATTSANANTAFQNTFSYETVQEATVTTLGGAAEAPNSGIQINLIIKSGGNDFHGEIPLAQTAKWMQSNNIDDELRAQGISDPAKFEERWDRGGDVGGRIKKDKLWFYTSARVRSEVNNVVGAPAYADGSPSQFTTNQKFAVGKLTAQLTPTQRFNVFGQWRSQNRKDGPENQFSSPEMYRQTTYLTRMGQGEWQMAKGNKVLSLQGGLYWIQFPVNPTLTDLSSWTDQQTGYSGGAETKVGQSRDMRRWEGKGTLNWYKPNLFLGDHEFKTGAHYDIARDLQMTTDVATCTPTEPIAALCNPASPGPGNYTLIYRTNVPFQVGIKNAPVDPKARLDYLGVYFQDSWSIHRRLTLNLGVRYANDRAWLPEQCREAAPAPFASLYPAQCFPEKHLKTYNPVVPRLHAAYDVTGDGKTVIKGGWGRFYNLHVQDELNLANPNASITTTFLWRDLNVNRHWDVGESNLDLNGGDFSSQSVAGVSGTLVGLVDNPDIKAPGSDEFSLSVERQLGATFAVRATGVYSRDFNTLRVLNTLRPYSAYSIPINNPDPGPDGRPGTADDPGTVVTYYDYPSSLRGAAFQRPMYINDAASDAHYQSFELALTRRLANRWQLQAAYSATKKHIPVPAGATYDPNAEINTSDF